MACLTIRVKQRPREPGAIAPPAGVLLFGAGQARHAELHHPRDDRQGGGAREAGQGVPARRGDARGPAPRDHPEPLRRAGHHRERRVRPRHPARAVRSQAQPGRGELHDHAQPRRHPPRHLRAHLPRELAVQQHAAAEAGGNRARRRRQRAVHGRPRGPARRGEVQGPGSAARELLDHRRRSEEHREGPERRDPEGRRPADPHGLAEDVGPARIRRARRSGPHQVPAAGARAWVPTRCRS